MCDQPIKLTDGTFVSCHKCWQCRENRIRDWCGRCIAESETSVASHSVTLTYGRDEDNNVDHLRAAVLTYSDVQKYLKRLRFAGFPCRYLVAGEHGDEKGRSHWHILLFWQQAVPPHEIRTKKSMAHCDYWTHGYTFWDDMNYKSVRYCCKYMQKNVDQVGHQSEFHMSKKPPIGAGYFRARAMKFVQQGLSPQDPFYTFPGVVDHEGKKHIFMMSGASLDLFCKAFVDAWGYEKASMYGHWPHSEMIDDYLNRMERKETIFPIVHPLSFEVEKRTIVKQDAEGNLTWHDVEREISLKDRWKRDYPNVPYPGRFEK